MNKTGHFDRRGLAVYCSVCDQRKCPRGRDGGLQWYGCDWSCAGYDQKPHVGSLWPGELATQFGFPVGSVGNEIVWVQYPEGWDDD